MAVDGLFSRTAGEIVNGASKDDAVSTRLVERGVEGLSYELFEFDLWSCEVVMYRWWTSFALSSMASIIKDTVREGALKSC